MFALEAFQIGTNTVAHKDKYLTVGKSLEIVSRMSISSYLEIQVD